MALAHISRARSLALATTLAVATFAPSAWPQDPKDLARARERFKEAAALQAAGDFARALDAYKDVAVVKSSAQVRFNIATCEEKLGDYLRATGSYRIALTEATRSNAKELEAAVQRALSDLEPRIPRLLVKRGEGGGVAEITLDGRPLANPSIGVEFQVNPGPHSVRATAPDKEPFSVEVVMPDREHKAVEVVMKAKPKAIAIAPKDGPLEPPPPPPEPPKSNKSLRTAGFVVGGVGVVGLIVSGVFFGMRQSAISTLDGECGPTHMTCPANAASTRDSGSRDATISTAMFVVGLAAAGVGTTLIIVGSRKQAPSPTAGLVLGPGGGSFAGAF
jgi:hypothetical protein